MKPKDRIQVHHKDFIIDEYAVQTHYYTRFIGSKTELFFFGAGLGDQTLFMQMGDCFLELCDLGEDPELGRIIFSMGLGASAFYPFKGDFNVCWPWGVHLNDIENHFQKMVVKPELMIGPWEDRRKRAEELGIPSLEFTVGVGRFFKPLGLKRSGLAYAGIDNKSKDQTNTVLGPALKRNDFEWHAKTVNSEYFTIPKLNEWYNSKQIMFGMIQEDRQRTDYMPVRIMETLASGTPLITYEVPIMNKYLSIKYPYQTTSYDETEKHIGTILNDFPNVLKFIAKISEHIRVEHNYTKKLTVLFDKLRELK